MNFKCKIGLHSWDGCKCSKCGKTNEKRHDWSNYICLNCKEIDYLGLLNQMYIAARIGNFVFDNKLTESANTKILAQNALDKCKTETEKQELICDKARYLALVISQSFFYTSA